MDIATPFDAALACLDGKIDKRAGFAVGKIPDGTGRESYNGQGVGKYVTQSAGDIVQSALWKTGVKVINRRDVGTTALEANWKLRDLKQQKTAQFAITGSINSLDFIPGGGAYVNIGGVGARYRQNRILVGLDLAMTVVGTGQVVANIALRKQIVADEAGLFGTAYVNHGILDNKIIDADIGGMRREALNDALRSMLQLATYELLTQLIPLEKHQECSNLIDPRYGKVTGAGTAGGQLAKHQDKQKETAGASIKTDEDANLPTSKNAEKPLTSETETVVTSDDDTDKSENNIKPEQGGAAYSEGSSGNTGAHFEPKRNSVLPSHANTDGPAS